MATYRLNVSVDIVTDEPVDTEDFAYLMACSYTNWIIEELQESEVIDPALVKVEKLDE